MFKNFCTYFYILTGIALLCLTSCGQKAPELSNISKSSGFSYQEQYDLGIRYLSEGNYEEAIIAFTAAIEIDPKQTSAYISRGNAYILLGETEDNLSAAQIDYEKAIELDELLVDAYLGLADVYIRQENYEKALEILQCGFEKASDDKIEEKIYEVLVATDDFVSGNTVKFTPFNELDSSTQFLIETLMDKVITNPDEAVGLLSTDYIDLIDQGIAPKELRTMRNNCKIQMRFLNYNGSNPGGEFEMRPITGTAYYCSGAYCEGRLHVNHGWGTCADWNWNGPFELTDTVSSGYRFYKSGNCVNGLLDGSVYTTLSQEYINAIPNAANNYYTYYDMGKEIKTVYSDGFDHPAANYSDNDVFFYASRTDIGWYEYWILW